MNVRDLGDTKSIKGAGQPRQHDALASGQNIRALIEHSVSAGCEGGRTHGNGGTSQKMAAFGGEQLLAFPAGTGKRLNIEPAGQSSQATKQIKAGPCHEPGQRGKHPPAKRRLQQRGLDREVGRLVRRPGPQEIIGQKHEVKSQPQAGGPAARGPPLDELHPQAANLPQPEDLTGEKQNES